MFVLLTSARYISTKLIDTIPVTNAKGVKEEYRHPFFQAVVGYLGEFIVVSCLYFWHRCNSPKELKHSKLGIWRLAMPALCDYFENLCLIFAMTQIFPSLVSMSRALVVPITALLSKLIIRKFFNWKMLLALAFLFSGMTLATFVQFEHEMSSNEFKLTFMGISLLCISAFV